jgi:hypothetical protein
VTIKKANVRSRALLKLSAMPEGLINYLGKDEILDLIAYLEAGGNPDHPDFRPAAAEGPAKPPAAGNAQPPKAEAGR